ncbi:MAG: response regulator [Chloroflexota bacterium]
MNYKVLVIDDEPMSRALLRLTLQENNFDVMEANDGLAALTMIGQQQPDLIIVDVVMPSLSGLDLCRIVRQNNQFGTIPILIVSAKAQMEAVRAGMLAGATHYLTKPISRRELVRVVTGLLPAPLAN